MKIQFLFAALFLISVSFAQEKGTVTGTLTDKEANNATLPFANAVIKGTTLGVTTDADGNYTIAVPAGTHTIVFSFLGYENVEETFTIAGGETRTINKALGSGAYTLQDVQIQAAVTREKETALLLEQKKAVEIKQSIGAQEMSRKGVSDVEEGLTKITGIAKVESRGLFVRGLEDRYNNLLINDLQAPSNSPFKKIIPLDLFPTDIVGVLSVYKTFNPNIPGDFAGATINVETAQPRTSITKLGVGFGFTTANNGEDFLISEDANNTQGFLGLVGKDRELPYYYGGRPSGKVATPDQYAESSKQNSWNVDRTSSPINSSITMLHAEKFNIGDTGKINYIVSINGDNNYQIRKGVDRTFNQGQGNYDNNLSTSKYSYNTSFSGLAGIRYKSNRLGLAVNSFFLRSTSSIIQDQLGYTNSLSNNPNILIRANQFEESEYWNNQLLADYAITENGKHSVKGGIAYVKTSFGQPDRKFITGEKINDTEINTTYGGNNLIRQFLDVSGDRYFSSMLEYSLKFNEKANGKSNKIAIGYNGFNNEEVSSYRFVFGKPLVSTSYVASLNDIDDRINQDVASGLLRFTEESTGDYKSKLLQTVNAGYLNAFFNFGEKWEINAGLRAENSLREIKYRQISDDFSAKYRKIEKEKLDILPSVNVKYALNDISNIRLAGSKTITKPVSIEVMPIQYVNPDGTVELGNPNLDNSDNLNLDVKYEIFPTNKELIAVGVFGKQIDNPIERVFIPTASSGGQITTYQNSQKATLYGAEFELLLQLSRIAPAFDAFSFGFNTSLMQTEVEVDLVTNPLENNAKRDLQGAANWVVNADIKYDFQFNEEMKNTISFVYGVSGDRIYAVGTAGLDNIYEKPFHKLDFVWSSKLSQNIDLKLAVDNILNPTFKRELGKDSKVNITESDLTVRTFKRGTGFSLNINYTF
ncbi:TonB-dependent receptor [Flavobacterium caeni]|uniref:Outer membrane receptor proteins, mostly Fe transport n=1 Tax=Flavobacterium caeni TaxID=490189 RepID=A0A1G5G5D4_9FLAO|nr:TonB-dependent receptor [Flavobacterium caeni]SCY46806.1 Outer membrane receptor proteins, mostly Fe transport [Flavobacterium caeni]